MRARKYTDNENPIWNLLSWKPEKQSAQQSKVCNLSDVIWPKLRPDVRSYLTGSEGKDITVRHCPGKTRKYRNVVDKLL